MPPPVGGSSLSRCVRPTRSTEVNTWKTLVAIYDQAFYNPLSLALSSQQTLHSSQGSHCCSQAMRALFSISTLAGIAAATILQNGQIRPADYPSTAINAILPSDNDWRTYPPNASELSYKGRWDDQHISWWSAPGLKFGFHASDVAVSFGPHTTEGVLIAYRLDGQDWTLTNVTANSTQHLIKPTTPGYNLTSASAIRTLEFRVTNWAYGVQLSAVHVRGGNCSLVKIPDYTRTMEFIGDSLSAGQYATLEGISSNPWGLMYGLGNVEFSITAYPGICLHDSRCYGTLSWMKP